ncbi:MAG: TetR/AcrR family transcriptional regulator [Proteobacteria bacterium]|nr:TetR/AcrR family transcriptional regulator [Pseudomonadota bacterium]
MGRKRRANRDEIIDAVGAVIREQGLDALSIDAVAKVAGIGKTSVLYDFKNRDTLLAAFVERRIRLHRDTVESLRADHAGKPDATMRALLDFVSQPPAQEDLGNGMLVAAAVSRHEGFRTFLAETFASEMRQIEAESANPHRARLCYLTLHGLLALECFGFCRLDEDIRKTTIEDIRELLALTPVPSEKPAVQAPVPASASGLQTKVSL